MMLVPIVSGTLVSLAIAFRTWLGSREKTAAALVLSSPQSARDLLGSVRNSSSLSGLVARSAITAVTFMTSFLFLELLMMTVQTIARTALNVKIDDTRTGRTLPRNGRSPETTRRSDDAGWTEHGYRASHSRYFLGLRLHLACTRARIPLAPQFFLRLFEEK
jgi:hypothetical protein